MEYTKPEIVASTEAVTTIQGTKDGEIVDSINTNLPLQTAAAYEADE